jgi:hypothetical protein
MYMYYVYRWLLLEAGHAVFWEMTFRIWASISSSIIFLKIPPTQFYLRRRYP